jgi:hypothetical protein
MAGPVNSLSACVLRQDLVDRSSTPGEAAAAIDARHGPAGELTYSWIASAAGSNMGKGDAQRINPYY